MNDLAEKLFTAVQSWHEDVVTEVLLELCKRPDGALLSWSLCRVSPNPARFRALTYAHSTVELDAIGRTCMFEPIRQSTDPSTLINSLELIRAHSSDARLRADASLLVLRCIDGEDALADAALDALSAYAQEGPAGISGCAEIAMRLRSRNWPLEFAGQVSDVLAFLEQTNRDMLKTEISQLDQAIALLEPYSKARAVFARCVRDACDVLRLRIKHELLRNDSIDHKSQRHVLRIGKPNSKPSLGVVAMVGNAWETFLTQVGVLADAGEPRITPLSAAPGSFEVVLSVTPKQHTPEFSQKLSEALIDPLAFPGLATAMTDVSNAARRSERLDVTVVDPERADWLGQSSLDKESAAKRELLLRPLTKHLTSMDVPQADSVQRVLKAIELISQDNLSAEALGLTTPRQVDYYKHAGRLLRMLDEENELTSTGRQLLRVSNNERYTVMATLFEVSKCGEAWIAWANVTRLPEIANGTATAFLSATTSGLSENTLGRRAQTLEKWLTDLGPRHYASVTHTT